MFLLDSSTLAIASGATGSGAVGRSLQSEDAVVVFARSCGSVCNKQPLHSYSARYRILGPERPGWCYPTGRCAYLPSVIRYRQSIPPPPLPPPRGDGTNDSQYLLLLLLLLLHGVTDGLYHFTSNLLSGITRRTRTVRGGCA